MRLSQYATGRDNNFNLVRFMAAFADWVEKILRGPGDLA